MTNTKGLEFTTTVGAFLTARPSAEVRERLAANIASVHEEARAKVAAERAAHDAVAVAERRVADQREWVDSLEAGGPFTADAVAELARLEAQLAAFRA